ncbi:SDH family Clp fold serine proteinase [Tautonia plasticadhaerens]|uniref:Serine dehydrogenase proteinase n=1 Tax=Tautonia plasticadhaerens TaxID=2527974 RepID=A0A518H7N9_9BACT|nr:serine protease [Tautonia plasticadhaerens]QDV36870.1 Serine dehydrogenase proteinase [Tautonia plasticadhaerens]
MSPDAPEQPGILPAILRRGLVAVALLSLPASTAPAAPQPAREPAEMPGYFFEVEQPIDSERADRLRSAVEAVLRSSTSRGPEPVLIFEVLPGSSEYGVSLQVADFIARKLARAEKTVAYVPEPLSGYAALVALACDEIVLGPDASIGPITPDGGEVNPGLFGFAELLGRAKGRSPDLIVGMLDPAAELLRVRTADGRVDYVLKDRLPEFEAAHAILEAEPFWQAGARGRLDADRARSEGIVRSFAADRAQVARLYDLQGVRDATGPGSGRLVPVWLRISGAIDATTGTYVGRELSRAIRDGANLVVLQLDTPGGQLRAADDLAQAILRYEDVKTVAYVRDRAMGVGALVALACDEIVFHRDGKLGKVDATVDGSSVDPLSDRDRDVVADRLASLAGQKGYPVAVARAMALPGVEVIEALDTDAAHVMLIDRAALDDEPGRFVDQGTVVPAGNVLTATADDSERLGLSRVVVGDDEQFKALYGIGDDLIQLRGPSWVDSLVGVLNTPFMSGLLLFIGFFMLVVEMKLPGIGLPAITSCLAFLLFFWSRYLGGTADGLEIILFIVGLLCLALELFVFPGFGIFGMSGVFLVLFSVVMASHTFIIPTEDFQYRQMSRTLALLVLSIAGVVVGAVLLGRFFPSLPFFDKLILRSDPDGSPDGTGEKPFFESDSPFAFLLGETGRTTTMLRPTGKARFGEIITDVIAERNFIEQDSLIQVVDVQGSRILVKQLS